MKRLGAALTLSLLAAAAKAERSNTPEYFYQPNVGAVALTFDYHQWSAATAQSQGGVKLRDVAESDTGYGLKIGYGMSDAWAFSILVSQDNWTRDETDTSNTTTSYKKTGLNDTTFMLTNISPLGGWSLHAGVGMGVSTGAHIDYNSTNNGNNLSGGMSIINYVGLSTTLAWISTDHNSPNEMLVS